MSNDVKIERIEELQQFANYLSRISDSLSQNFAQYENGMEFLLDDLHRYEVELSEKSSSVNNIVKKAEDFLSHKNPADVLQYNKLTEIVSNMRSLHDKISKEINVTLNTIRTNKNVIDKLREDKIDFKKNFDSLMEQGSDVVKKSIESITNYHSLNK